MKQLRPPGPPLTAIETPRITDHEGNNDRTSAPKYSFVPMISINPEPDNIPKTKATHSKSDPSNGK